MVRREKKPVHHVQMTEGKRTIIRRLPGNRGKIHFLCGKFEWKNKKFGCNKNSIGYWRLAVMVKLFRSMKFFDDKDILYDNEIFLIHR